VVICDTDIPYRSTKSWQRPSNFRSKWWFQLSQEEHLVL